MRCGRLSLVKLKAEALSQPWARAASTRPAARRWRCAVASVLSYSLTLAAQLLYYRSSCTIALAIASRGTSRTHQIYPAFATMHEMKRVSM